MGRYREPVAVIGLGRFGTALALELARSGTEVLAVDDDPEVVQRLSGQLAQVVVADATDPDALAEIGLADFTRVVVAIGTDLEASILATSLLAEMGIPDIWTKALSTQHANILRRIGAHHVVFPENEMGERVAHLVSGRLLDWVAPARSELTWLLVELDREPVGDESWERRYARRIAEHFAG